MSHSFFKAQGQRKWIRKIVRAKDSRHYYQDSIFPNLTTLLQT